MLVEPNNHRVNAAERAIQTFKDHFVSALATTDSDFPLQLWDRLTQQVVTTLNLLRPSRIDPTKSAYEALHGPGKSTYDKSVERRFESPSPVTPSPRGLSYYTTSDVTLQGFALGVRTRLTATGPGTPTLAEEPSFYTFVISTFTNYHKYTCTYDSW
jgi:hypothetical protein